MISHTPHALVEGEPRGWPATVREISEVASLFDEVVHVAPVYAAAEMGWCAYAAGNVRVAGVRPSGGKGLGAKAGVLMRSGEYLRVIGRELRRADAIHVRCPCNIGLLAVLMMCCVRRPRRRWIKYAGNWRPEGREPWSYRVQRWLLRRTWHGGVVTVNGEWPGDPAHVRAFFNPSFSEAELAEARHWGRQKALAGAVRCAFVGRVEKAKGAGRAVEIVRRLRDGGVEAELDVVGDGPLRAELERQAGGGWARFHGWLPRLEVARVWREAHVCLLPSSASEGWPKVLSEGMAWGAVPVASDVSSIPQYLERFGCGVALGAEDVEGFVAAVKRYVERPELWKAESERGMEAAELFTYEAHVRRVGEVMGSDKRRSSAPVEGE